MTLKSNWQLLWLLIALKMSRQFFQWEAKPKPMGPCTRDFSRALRKLSQVAVRNSDWFIALFAPVVIGRSYYFGIAYS